MSKISKEPKLILVGVISSAHGIKGNVVVQSYMDPISNIEKFSLLDKNNNLIKLRVIRPYKKDKLICVINDCNDRNQAESKQGTKLYCFRHNLPTLCNDDEFYIEDLKGLKVLDISGKDIGQVLEIVNYGAGDIIEISFNNSRTTEMFLFSKENFPIINKDHIVLSK